MAIRIKTAKLDDLSHQFGEGVPSHLSPIGSQFVNELNGDIYYNRDGGSSWELSVAHITNINYKQTTDQPDRYGKGGSDVMNDLMGGFVNKEVAVRVSNSNNKKFLLNSIPKLNSEDVYINGVLQDRERKPNYVLDGRTITFRVPIGESNTVLVSYIVDE